MIEKSEQSVDRQKWGQRITQAQKDQEDWWKSGQETVDTFRIERKNAAQKDKYNILYSNTETIKPALYAQMPKIEVKQNQRDRDDPVGLAASLCLESAVTYVVNQQSDDFDTVMLDVTQDLLLPGLGTIRCRYVPTMGILKDAQGQAVPDEDGREQQEVLSETVAIEYVYWKDLLWSRGRRWSEIWWVAFAVSMDREQFTKRFGEDKAKLTSFGTETARANNANKDESVDDDQVRIWEIWDKRAKKVRWICDNFQGDFLDEKNDPLKLQGFFPMPRPLRAITTSNKFLPRPFYAQYQAQADELNDITVRIRRLVDGLRIIGVFDASVSELSKLLEGSGNKMVPVQNWSTMLDKGGLKGVVDFLPLTDVVTTLIQLYDARDRVKSEIYEITGWSDIIRGVTKASETLGAQQLKSQWAGSRLKLMQRDVQRFIRDTYRIAGEIISEHFSPEAIALACGFQYSKDNVIFPVFQQVCQLLKTDKNRCALIDIETDSTLMPDEANDKQERMEFIGAAGSFLQQAVPAMQALPAMGPLLAAILMFGIRSFRSARPLEMEFEKFVRAMEQGGLPPPQGQDGGKQKEDPQAKAQAALVQAQQKQADIASKERIAEADRNADMQKHAEKMQLDREKEINRHSEQENKLGIDQQRADAEDERVVMDAHRHTAEQDAAEVDRQFRTRDADRADRAENKPKGP